MVEDFQVQNIVMVVSSTALKALRSYLGFFYCSIVTYIIVLLE